ncbi:hypothetical protein HYDPIDRAFT_171393 [Hydnomerulius pinastri MD-312]|uniref:C2H2-type domain-containing protein n=1 Tax=Hydnomerulius pinastri MD-312 TaxID=994086 RepID=A0A0C9W747_9AGAM|nr:hypothetical protein HYDPIDRAFT_171393 [Hydnomerulius pinastri MD-312]
MSSQFLNRLTCPVLGCPEHFKSHRGRTKHIRSAHPALNETTTSNASEAPGVDGGISRSRSQGPQVDTSRRLEGDEDFDFQPRSPGGDSNSNDVRDSPSRETVSQSANSPSRSQKVLHPHLNGNPCDDRGIDLPPNTLPPPRHTRPDDDWYPFMGQSSFLLADFLYRKVEMSADNIDFLMELWAFKSLKHDDTSPFIGHRDLYKTIDAVTEGDVPWQCLSGGYIGEVDEHSPSWKRAQYQVWFRNPDSIIRNMLDRPDFQGQFDYSPYVYTDNKDQQRWVDFMSGHYAWRQSDRIYESDPSTAGAMYCAERKYDDDLEFPILQPLKAGMTTPVVRRCPDGHYRRVIYDLGPFIADYPEQVLLAGIVQNWCAKCTACPDNLDGPGGRRTREFTDLLCGTLTSDELWDSYGIDDDIVPFTNNFPRADIYTMLSPDLLHQVIKGTFKDHLVAWTCSYILDSYGDARGNEVLDDINKRYICQQLQSTYPQKSSNVSAHFSTFATLSGGPKLESKTWTKHDGLSRGFTLIVKYSGVFVQRDSRSHEFGAPNGLCSSITESRHITAVKRPWRRSNRYEALGQMLLTNQRLDKLSAARVQFADRGMLPPTHSPPSNITSIPLQPGLAREGDEEPDDDRAEHAALDMERVESFVQLARQPQRGYPRNLIALAAHVAQPSLPALVEKFLRDQLINHPTHSLRREYEATGEENFPSLNDTAFSVFHSATANYFAPIKAGHERNGSW